MNPLKSKFFKTVATIKQGGTIEFDITDQDQYWPEAYSFVSTWLENNPCGIDMIKTSDSTKITISRGKTSAPPKDVPCTEDVVVEPAAEEESAAEEEPAAEEASLLKKPWWGNNQWNSD